MRRLTVANCTTLAVLVRRQMSKGMMVERGSGEEEDVLDDMIHSLQIG
jgi:hypothetical protein